MGYPRCENGGVDKDAVYFYSGDPERRFLQLMVLTADPHLIYTEEQRRLMASVYANILKVKFTVIRKAQEFRRTTRPAKTCQPRLIGITHVLDAHELFSQEAGE
jgi:hypothetical protein